MCDRASRSCFLLMNNADDNRTATRVAIEAAPQCKPSAVGFSRTRAGLLRRAGNSGCGARAEYDCQPRPLHGRGRLGVPGSEGNRPQSEAGWAARDWHFSPKATANYKHPGPEQQRPVFSLPNRGMTPATLIVHYLTWRLHLPYLARSSHCLI